MLLIAVQYAKLYEEGNVPVPVPSYVASYRVPGMTVRRAEPADAAAIAAVHVRSWQGAYRGLLPQEFLDGLSVERRVDGWEHRLADLDWPRSGTLVATDADEVVGFVDIAPTRDDDSDPDAVAELIAIYVLPGAFGTGVGRELMRAALTAMRDAGYGEATLWVLANNDRAIGFYEVGGWRPDGARKDDQIGGVSVTEARYRHPLR